MDGTRSRRSRQLRQPRAATPRRIELTLALFFVLTLATASAGLNDYWRNLAQNTAADLIGAVVFAHVIIPAAHRQKRDAIAEEDGDQTLIATMVDRGAAIDVPRVSSRGLDGIRAFLPTPFQQSAPAPADEASDTGDVTARRGGRAVSGIKRPPGRGVSPAVVRASGVSVAIGDGSIAVSGIDYS